MVDFLSVFNTLFSRIYTRKIVINETVFFMIWDNLYARQYEFKSYCIKYVANWHILLQLLSIVHTALNKPSNIITIPCLRGGLDNS